MPRILLVAAITLMASPALAYNCSDSCQNQARIGNGLGGTVINPAKLAACKAYKATQCYDLPGDIVDPVGTLCREVGGDAYREAAQVMRERHAFHDRRKLNRSEREFFEPIFGEMVHRVVLIFGARPLDQIGRGQYRIDMGTGAQTFGYDIYVEHTQSQANRHPARHLEFVGHELTHVEQYVTLGGSLKKFGQAYFQSWCAAGMSYSNNILEKEAVHKEKGIANAAEIFVDPYNDRKNTHALACISNKTNLPITYQYKWGRMNWKTKTLDPGKVRNHSWRYEFMNENRSPRFEVRFYEGRTRTSSLKHYTITSWANEHKVCNRVDQRENFKYQSNTSDLIDLYRNY